MPQPIGLKAYEYKVERKSVQIPQLKLSQIEPTFTPSDLVSPRRRKF